MSKNATKLVQGLRKLGFLIEGDRFMILRHHGQPMMNKAYHELAPCWHVLADPLCDTRTNKVVFIGDSDQIRVTFPNGQSKVMQISSHYPLTHIVNSSLDQWEVDEDEWGRLWVTTIELPTSWE